MRAANEARIALSEFSADTLFTAALALPESERAVYLQRACAGDRAMYEKVHSLLAAASEAAQFIKEPQAKLASSEGVGARIDQYLLLEELGEGGGGVVYRAEQLEPVRREVALKILKLGMDTKAFIHRFAAERQALAMMDHPHIARVFDAGATPAGRPYFVMELVRGVKITEYCDQCRLSVPERLELFIQVCQAIHHAHAKGVIHRDIKPSNVLVTLSDGRPWVKVIDFGVAKAAQGRLTEHTLHTLMGQFIGTPAYVSPEQTEWGAPNVDARSDVYSLGVLLYELLTGCTPFDAEELNSLGVERLRQRIREEEPITPSRRLDALSYERLQRIAARQHASPERLIKQVHGDLDWIVLRCLEKEPKRRYRSAGELALDVQRHLNHEPISARKPSLYYTVQKFAQRHRTVFITGLAIIAVLITATAVSTWQAVRARQAEKLAQQTIDSLVNVFSAADPFSNQGAGFSANELLERASKAANEMRRHPDVQARLLESIARIHRRRGDLRQALHVAQQALSIRQTMKNGGGPEALRTHLETALTYLVMGELTNAVAQLDEGLARAVQLGATQSPMYTQLWTTKGRVQLAMGAHRAAQRSLEHALVLTQNLGQASAVETAVVLMLLSEVHQWTSELEAAEMNAREALAIIEAQRPAAHPDRAIAATRLGEVLHLRFRSEEAAQLFTYALNVYTSSLGAESAQTAQSYDLLSKAHRAAERTEEALRDAREAVRISEQAEGPDKPTTARYRSWLAMLLMEQGRFAEAESEQRRAIAALKQALPTDHPHITFSEYALGELLLATGRLAEAEQLLNSALNRWKRANAPAWRHARYASALGEVLFREGRLQEAEPLLVDSYRMLATSFGVDRYAREKARERLRRFYLATGRRSEADALSQDLH